MMNNTCKNCNDTRLVINSDYYLVCVNCGQVSPNKYFMDNYSDLYRFSNGFFVNNYCRNKSFAIFLRKTPEINSYIRNKLLDQFITINNIWCDIKHKRKRIIRFSYIAVQLLIANNYYNLSKNIKIKLKNKTIYKYDKLWKQVCIHLNIEFRRLSEISPKGMYKTI